MRNHYHFWDVAPSMGVKKGYQVERLFLRIPCPRGCMWPISWCLLEWFVGVGGKCWECSQGILAGKKPRSPFQ